MKTSTSLSVILAASVCLQLPPASADDAANFLFSWTKEVDPPADSEEASGPPSSTVAGVPSGRSALNPFTPLHPAVAWSVLTAPNYGATVSPIVRRGSGSTEWTTTCRAFDGKTDKEERLQLFGCSLTMRRKDGELGPNLIGGILAVPPGTGYFAVPHSKNEEAGSGVVVADTEKATRKFYAVGDKVANLRHSCMLHRSVTGIFPDLPVPPTDPTDVIPANLITPVMWLSMKSTGVVELRDRPTYPNVGMVDAEVKKGEEKDYSGNCFVYDTDLAEHYANVYHLVHPRGMDAFILGIPVATPQPDIPDLSRSKAALTYLINADAQATSGDVSPAEDEEASNEDVAQGGGAYYALGEAAKGRRVATPVNIGTGLAEEMKDGGKVKVAEYPITECAVKFVENGVLEIKCGSSKKSSHIPKTTLKTPFSWKVKNLGSKVGRRLRQLLPGTKPSGKMKVLLLPNRSVTVTCTKKLEECRFTRADPAPAVPAPAVPDPAVPAPADADPADADPADADPADADPADAAPKV